MPLEFDARPTRVVDAAGKPRFAFVTLVMMNDGFVPGALLQAYALKTMGTRADVLCMVTEDVSEKARVILRHAFDEIIEVPKLYLKHRRAAKQPNLSFMFTRFHCLRLGRDGDLGTGYDKIVVLDADVLPLRNYDHLWCLDTPAGVLNERKAHMIAIDAQGKQQVSPEMLARKQWHWHAHYSALCPHGAAIPKTITDRLTHDASNMGINGALYVISPSIAEYHSICRDLEVPSIRQQVSQHFDWPEMQYLTLKWSGSWHNVDARFCSINGYPDLSILFGTHYAGVKPWSMQHKSFAHYARFADFQHWHYQFLAMLEATPALARVRRLQRLRDAIMKVK